MPAPPCSTRRRTICWPATTGAPRDDPGATVLTVPPNRTAMRLMNTLRTSREKETRLPIMPLDCSPGMWCSTARRLTRGVLGWDTLGGPDAGIFDTLGGPDPGIFDTLGGPDRRAGED